MALPEQRGTGLSRLRATIARFFAYWDADDSGELSLSELETLLKKVINNDFHETPQPYLVNGEIWKHQNLREVPEAVMESLLSRYDTNSDGTVAIEAARRGATAVCIESDPTLAAAAEAAVSAADVGGRVTVRRENFFSTDLSDATVVSSPCGSSPRSRSW